MGIGKLILDGLIDEFKSESEKNEKIEKTFPIKKDWKALLDDWSAVEDRIEELHKEAHPLIEEARVKRNIFWNAVKTDLGMFDRVFYINKEDDVIELLEKEDEECK